MNGDTNVMDLLAGSHLVIQQDLLDFKEPGPPRDAFGLERWRNSQTDGLITCHRCL